MSWILLLQNKNSFNKLNSYHPTYRPKECNNLFMVLIWNYKEMINHLIANQNLLIKVNLFQIQMETIINQHKVNSINHIKINQISNLLITMLVTIIYHLKSRQNYVKMLKIINFLSTLNSQIVLLICNLIKIFKLIPKVSLKMHSINKINISNLIFNHTVFNNFPILIPKFIPNL